MIRVLVSLLFFVSGNVLGQESASKSLLSAEVVNVRNDSGSVGFALYDEESFMKTPIQAAYIKVASGKAIVEFKDLEPGVYAILCYHDENGNNKMDFESNGMPKEDYGMSTNFMGYGPPTFEQAKFNFNGENLKLEIKF
ncbi:MAG: DUF2141 domain-containing protein [Flavobacteriaceae bacterium]